jgi:hypothetical protein
MDFYNLSQQDFHTLEEKFLEHPEVLNQKDTVCFLTFSKTASHFDKFYSLISE